MGGGEAGGVMKTRYKVILISLGAIVCMLLAVSVVLAGEDSARVAGSDTVGVGADTSCVNADSILIIQAGPRDRTLRTVVIRKKPFKRPCPGCLGYYENVVSCETYDTLADILADFTEERSLSNTLEWGSFDFLATIKGETVARYMTGRKDSIRLLNCLIDAVERMDKDNRLLRNLKEYQGEIDK